MAPSAPRTNLNSSRLIRLLAELTIVEVPESKQSLAERLGLWLGWADAISLSAALGGNAAAASGVQSGTPFSAGAAAAAFARVRADLAASITTDEVLTATQASRKLPAQALDAAIESAADFGPYRRCYVGHQRAMEAGIRLLRANVRAALGGVSPRLNQLAGLDAIMDGVLGTHERSLLSTVPSLLEKRFNGLRKRHQDTLVDPGPGERDPRLPQAPGWLAAYGKDMQGVLLAELDIRMQPVEGLIEALDHEITRQ